MKHIFFDLIKLTTLQKNKQLICSFWDQSDIYNLSKSLVVGFHRTFVIKFLKKSVFLRKLCDALSFWSKILSHLLNMSLNDLGNFLDLKSIHTLLSANLCKAVNEAFNNRA